VNIGDASWSFIAWVYLNLYCSFFTGSKHLHTSTSSILLIFVRLIRMC
jgi:hypothetical protein